MGRTASILIILALLVVGALPVVLVISRIRYAPSGPVFAFTSPVSTVALPPTHLKATAVVPVPATPVRPHASPSAKPELTTTPTAAGGPTETASSTATPAIVAASARSTVYLGVWQPGAPANMSALATFEKHARKKVAIVMFWRDWGSDKRILYTSWLRAIQHHGAIPIISWAPENWATKQNAQYSLRRIVAGKFDTYLRSWATQLKEYGGPVLLRWGYEMNGDWNPWGWQPREYVAAWRHIHDLFAQVGAKNVQWVWSPNTEWDDPRSNFAPYFPGNKYVDWVGLDSYNQPENGKWLSFTQLFRKSYLDITALSPRPVMIPEFSSAESNLFPDAAVPSKAVWILDAFENGIPSMPRIKAVVWFNENKEPNNPDWRIESSSGAVRAFAEAVSSPMYLSHWGPQ